MRLLLDTNIVLFFQQNSDRLSSEWKHSILDADNEKFISMATIWEVAIKFSLGKLSLDDGLEAWISDIETEEELFLLPIMESHILQSAKLPFIHRDPFDRLIFAQSVTEDMELLSTDSVFDRYREVT